MENEQTIEPKTETEVLPAAPKKRGARPGCIKPLASGRRAKSWAAAREIATELGIEPFRLMLEIIQNGTISTVKLVDGRRVKVDVDVSVAERLDLLKQTARFLYPTLSATQVKAETTVEHRSVIADDQMKRLMSTPEGAAAAQKLALMLAALPEDAPAQAQIPGPVPVQTIESEAQPVERDFNDDLRTDHRGHWVPRLG